MNGRIHVADFETTVYDGQTSTEVWAASTVELWTEDVLVFHSIDMLFSYYKALPGNQVVYFHNLKFDGSFWLDYLLRLQKFTQAYVVNNLEDFSCYWLKDKEMPNNSFKYSISNRGQWYRFTIKVNGKIIELRDSLKLLPFSVKQIGQSFGTKHKKLDMEYKGFRYAGCEITPKEQAYIKNDVLVLKEALELMFIEGHKKLTIGSCCLEEFRKTFDSVDYQQFFPNLYEIELNEKTHGYRTAGDFINKSYRGGWCYYVKGKEGRIYRKGVTADVNSLYPSVMHSMSGTYYPVGKPKFWSGNFIPEDALKNHRYYFLRIRTRFYLKPGYLPFIQVKGDLHYSRTESLTTSDIYNPRDGKYYPEYRDIEGNVHQATVEMVVTMTDYALMKEHYELVDFEILGGCWFYSEIGLFDEYIDKYKKIKETSKGAVRTLAKLFLNNLYGKMASSPDSSFKVVMLKEDGTIGFIEVKEMEKKPGYIPIGSAITSYARDFTIRAAQKNFHGVDKPGFIYADTDSIHCDLRPEDLVGIKVHPTEFCCWKLESVWDLGLFVRQKTYIEHVIEEDVFYNVSRETWEGEPSDTYTVRCAGMSDKAKNIFLESVKPFRRRKEDLLQIGYTEEQANYIMRGNDIQDFKIGMVIPDGKLKPKRMIGGLVLQEGEYHMR